MPFLYYNHYCCRSSASPVNNQIATVSKFINTHKELIASDGELFPLSVSSFPNSFDKLLDLPPELISEHVLKLQDQLINTVSNSRELNPTDKIHLITRAVKNPNKSCYAILDALSRVFAAAGFLALPEVYRKLPPKIFSDDDPEPHFMLYLIQFFLVLTVPLFITLVSSELQKKHTKQNRNISNDQEKFELWLFDVKKQIDMVNPRRVSLSTINEEVEGIELYSNKLTP